MALKEPNNLNMDKSLESKATNRKKNIPKYTNIFYAKKNQRAS